MLWRAVHEYGQIPGMVDPNDIDPTFHLGESNAMLRYIANKYHKEAYPVGDPARCAQIDFAIDSFNRVVEKHAPVVYPLLGFIPPRARAPHHEPAPPRRASAASAGLTTRHPMRSAGGRLR